MLYPFFDLVIPNVLFVFLFFSSPFCDCLGEAKRETKIGKEQAKTSIAIEKIGKERRQRDRMKDRKASKEEKKAKKKKKKKKKQKRKLQ